ncbi:MAG TPA: hypothetical protein VK203_12360 [Nostocaceae cyanobacterium]|nr:hypothetical protein [Nostocaceae cyanobacterium]
MPIFTQKEATIQSDRFLHISKVDKQVLAYFLKANFTSCLGQQIHISEIYPSFITFDNRKFRTLIVQGFQQFINIRKYF